MDLFDLMEKVKKKDITWDYLLEFEDKIVFTQADAYLDQDVEDVKDVLRITESHVKFESYAKGYLKEHELDFQSDKPIVYINYEISNT